MDVVKELNTPALIGGVAALVALVASHLAHRTWLPAPALFLALGIGVNVLSESTHTFINTENIVQIGSIALVFILFEGGFSGGFQRFRRSLWPVTAMGMLGTFVTTLALALAAHYLLGLSWEVGALIGIALAPTDPAAVFSILGNRDLRGRSGAIIEGESGVNDPVSIALMVGMLEYIDGHGSAGGIGVEFVIGLLIGAVVGGVLGLAAGRVLSRLRMEPESLFPLAAIACAFGIYAIAGLLHGSGFLAALVAGLVMGDQLRAHESIGALVGLCAALAEIVMFTILGITVGLSALGEQLGAGLVMFLVLTFLVRPAATVALLAPARLDWSERLFISWGGLKGAVPILLAAFVVLGDAPSAEHIYAIVFVAVTASIVVQGGTIPWLIDKLNLLDEPPPPTRRYFPH